jgi:hypothetical protein
MLLNGFWVAALTTGLLNHLMKPLMIASSSAAPISCESWGWPQNTSSERVLPVSSRLGLSTRLACLTASCCHHIAPWEPPSTPSSGLELRHQECHWYNTPQMRPPRKYYGWPATSIAVFVSGICIQLFCTIYDFIKRSIREAKGDICKDNGGASQGNS